MYSQQSDFDRMATACRALRADAGAEPMKLDTVACANGIVEIANAAKTNRAR